MRWVQFAVSLSLLLFSQLHIFSGVARIKENKKWIICQRTNGMIVDLYISGKKFRRYEYLWNQMQPIAEPDMCVSVSKNWRPFGLKDDEGKSINSWTSKEFACTQTHTELPVFFCRDFAFNWTMVLQLLLLLFLREISSVETKYKNHQWNEGKSHFNWISRFWCFALEHAKNSNNNNNNDEESCNRAADREKKRNL